MRNVRGGCRRFRRGLLVALSLSVIGCARSESASSSKPADDPTPQTLSEFQAAATRILQQTAVPGAGIALVRQQGVEWAGGLGLADRERGTPVTADTHFRLGSISKTFVAMGLVQLYEDGTIDLNAPIDEVVPEIAIDNPWHATEPVRVIHILQHTTGFDDMHFNDRYVPDGAPDLSLADVLALNPGSRRVRWRPGTRMSYSNVGYGLAGLILEKTAGEPYEDYIKREIFDPLGMTTSSFRLTAQDEPLLARGYGAPAGPPVGFPRIHLRPAGNLHSSAREMGRFVQMLLGWGELGTAFVVDPEYLGNMEQPRTTLAAAAGLRSGYGTGIAATLTLPYRVLGHNGGIDGFLSSYGYSPSRDAGYVILLNSVQAGASDAVTRLSSLAIRYLKREVEAPAKPETRVDPATLDQYVGYYHDANPRNQLTWALRRLTAGRTISRDGDALVEAPVFGDSLRLIPVSDTAFRLEHELDASRIFTTDPEGIMVLTGPALYAERVPRWRVEIVRAPLLASVPLVLSVFVVAVAWIVRVRRARPRAFWALKAAILLCPVVLALPFATLALTPTRAWGVPGVGTMLAFVGSLAIPFSGLVVVLLAFQARRAAASRWLTRYAFLIAAAMIGVSFYLGAHGLLGLRTWNY